MPPETNLNDDMLIAYGGAVKALGEGRIQGYLVRFTDAEHLDLEGEFFDARTDYDIKAGERTSIYYHHGQEKMLGRRKIGEGALKIDEVGVWLEGQLDLRDGYEQAIYRMSEQGKMGFSSGTATHLIEREPEGKGTHITRWPLRLDASLTPTPAEPSTQVLTLKAYKAMEHEPLGVQEPQGDVQTPPASTATKATKPPKPKAKRKGGKTMFDIRRIQIGATHYAYKFVLDEETQKTERAGDPLFASIKAEDVDTFITDAKMTPDARALQAVVKGFEATMDKMAKAFTARTGAQEPGLYAGSEPATVKGQATFGDFLLAVGRKDRGALKAMGSTFEEYEQVDGTKVLGDQTGASGGFLVPTQYLPELIRIDPETEIVWPTGDVIPMSSRSVEVPGIATTGSTAGRTNCFGGAFFYWTETGTLKSETDIEFSQIELVAHEISAWIPVKEALLQDSAVSLDPLIKGIFRDGLMYYTDESFLDGTGAGMPQGIVTAPGTLVLARDTVLRILYADLTNMFMHFMPQARGGAFWVINQFCMQEIMQIQDPAGNYIWQPNAREGQPSTIFGLPVRWTEKTPTLGAQGDIILMNPKWYYIGRRQGVTVATSEHVRFLHNQIVYKCVMRLDGQEKLPAPVFAKDGQNQISPFVELGAAAT